MRPRRFETAGVIVHDALVPSCLLALARRGARLVPVGKRAEVPSVGRDPINCMMMLDARLGLRVVRLRRGDPFFGRGEEVAAYLRERGIVVHLIPGATSAIGRSSPPV